MGFFEKYPNTDFHELNLDWLIAKMKELDIKFDEFKVVNNITFSGQWDITKQYPAWTIVSDNNIGYVSQKPVPAGVNINNGAYWVEVIDYTAQIAGLESRVIALEGDVISLQNADTALSGRITTNTNDIASINRHLQKDVIFIGDSYADPNRGGYANGWITIAQQILGLDADHTHIYQMGGAGFVGAGMGVTFGDLATQAINDITGDDRNYISDIVISGGCNDADASISLGDLSTAVLNVIQALHTVFPNAIIRIAAIGGFLKYGNTDYMERVYAAYNNYYNTMSYLMPIMNANVPMLMANSYDVDGIHPGQLGVIRIGTVIGTATKGNNNLGKINERSTMALTPVSGLTIGGQTPQIQLEETGIRICLRENISINGSNTYTSGGNVIDIATLETNSIISTCSGKNSLPKYAMIPVNIEIYGLDNLGASLRVWYDSVADKLTLSLAIEGISVGSLPYTTTLLRIRPFNILINSIC